ncbi:MAG: LysR family transcriptional regulator [Lachnospiraceae bacterium]|nr:LysR family transcriptional regulator [Lachnospiraceae bacterium]
MNVSTLEYFVSAAELLNFTKAAQKHYIAQTAVSQQVARLEKELGVKLFIRNKNRVALTNAGQIFYNDVKNILSQYEVAVNKAQISYQQEKKVITIGYADPSELSLISDLIIEFQEANPDTEIIIKSANLSNLVEDLHLGLCDLCINMSCSFDCLDMKNLEQYSIHHGEMLLAVGMNHPKADRESINADELKDEKFIVLNAENSNLGISEMHKHCKMDGYELQISDYVGSIAAQLLMIELNRGVGFVQDLLRTTRMDKIKLLPIKNSAHRYDMNIAWNSSASNPTLKSFISLIKERLPKNK